MQHWQDENLGKQICMLIMDQLKGPDICTKSVYHIPQYEVLTKYLNHLDVNKIYPSNKIIKIATNH